MNIKELRTKEGLSQSALAKKLGIAAKIPAGAESVFVRVDQNKLWWIKGEETGSVDIW